MCRKLGYFRRTSDNTMFPTLCLYGSGQDASGTPVRYLKYGAIRIEDSLIRNQVIIGGPLLLERRYEQELRNLIYENGWFMEVLRAVRDCYLPDWFVGAGVIRSLVWDHFHGYSSRTPLKDVDVVYFDSKNLSQERDKYLLGLLKGKLRDVPWEVTNQAAVHIWFEEYFGYSVLPLGSIEEAVSTWPETATSIGVRLLPTDELNICAPFGLEDLFNMTLRRNPRRVTLELYRERVKEKRILLKWPKVKVIDG